MSNKLLEAMSKVKPVYPKGSPVGEVATWCVSSIRAIKAENEALKAEIAQLREEHHNMGHGLLNTLDYHNGHKVNAVGDELFDDGWVGVMESVGSDLLSLGMVKAISNNTYAITKKGLDIMWSPTLCDLNR